METRIYMVRHAKSPFRIEDQKTRELSPEGHADAHQVADILEPEQIDVFASSDNARAIQTIEEAARRRQQQIQQYEELKELILRGPEHHLEDHEVAGEVEKVFADSTYRLPGGETAAEAKKRGLPVFLQLLRENIGKRIAIGTHGIIMTLIMRHFDPKYGFPFWKKTSKPDIYALTFEHEEIQMVERLWRKKNQ